MNIQEQKKEIEELLLSLKDENSYTIATTLVDVYGYRKPDNTAIYKMAFDEGVLQGKNEVIERQKQIIDELIAVSKK